ncbi:hypothetical protein [Enterobacter hormaechei]|uniref:hypothetical protein n=1 Tax=Enterobacter hormaechei TaxID=158836 RepID=UPI003F432C36
MTIKATLPITGSQIKAETGMSSMLASGRALGKATPFTLSSLKGLTYGNLFLVPGNKQNLNYGYGSGFGSITRNTVGGNLTGLTGFAGVLGGQMALLNLNNWKQGSYSIFVKNNGKTYSFVKMPNNTNSYYIPAGAAATEFFNLCKGNIGKTLICVVTPK